VNLFKRLGQVPRPLLLRWLAGLALVTGLAVVFYALAEDVWEQETFAWDATVAHAVHALSTPWLDAGLRVVTETGYAGAVVLIVGLTAWFVWRRRWLDATTTLVCYTGATVFNLLIKLIFARPRPTLFPPLIVLTDFSFPSGHVTATVASYGLLAVWLWRGQHPAWALLAAAWVPVIAFTRVYLGVHYPSDTLASLAFASLWLMLVFFIRDTYERRRGRALA
jgi:undecaprenyl-diphosphatase